MHVDRYQYLVGWFYIQVIVCLGNISNFSLYYACVRVSVCGGVQINLVFSLAQAQAEQYIWKMDCFVDFLLLIDFFDFDTEVSLPLLGAIAGAVLPPGLPCLPVPDVLGPIPSANHPVVFVSWQTCQTN